MGRAPEDTFTAQIRDILRIANGLKEVTAACNMTSHSPFRACHLPVATNSDSINLPGPRPLLPSLLEAGADHEVAAAAGKIYQLHAEELRQHILRSIVTAWDKIAELPVVASAASPDLLQKKIVSVAAEVYLQRLGQWKKEIVQCVKQASKPPSNAVAPGNARFNHEFVPLLERFFGENPFPTHADKVFLARKSNMQYRQIHVWFQNRRSRTKKETKALRKKPTYERPAKPLDKLCEHIQGHMVNPNPQFSKPCKASLSEGTAGNNVSKDVFASPSPPHAFPSSYPPISYYDPFPCKSGPACLSEPQWRRVPHGKSTLALSTDIDDLVERFSHFNVRGETRINGIPKLQSYAATAAITVMPCRAPHPSLIVSKHLQPTKTAELHPSVRASLYFERSSKSRPCLKACYIGTLSDPFDRSKLRKWKTISVPQHIPSRTRNICWDTTPCSLTSPSSPCSLSTDTKL